MALEVHGSSIIHAPVDQVWDYITLTEDGPLSQLLGGQPVEFNPSAERMSAGMRASTNIEVANFLNLGRDEKFPLTVHIDDVNHDSRSFDTSVEGMMFFRGKASVRLVRLSSDDMKTEILFKFRLPIIAMVVKTQIQAGVNEVMPSVGKIISRRFKA